MIRRAAVYFLAISCGMLLACSAASPAVCSPLRLTASAEAALADAAASLGVAPQRPCAFRDAFEVAAVVTDTLPGTPPSSRVTFIVTRREERAFTFSATRAVVLFSAIPQGTHRLRIAAGRTVAEGFAGPSGTGMDSAYLRWRTDDITYELAATLHSWLTEADVRAIATAMLQP